MAENVNDHDELRCPLPVVRYVLDDDGGGGYFVLGPCGEPLCVTYERDEAVQRVGEQDLCGTTWKVICPAGHILLMPDHEGSDDFDRIPFEREFLNEVLSRLVAPVGNQEGQKMSNEKALRNA